MIGGGNYLEYESLATWAGRATPPKSIVYGATDLLTGEQARLPPARCRRWPPGVVLAPPAWARRAAWERCAQRTRRPSCRAGVRMRAAEPADR